MSSTPGAIFDQGMGAGFGRSARRWHRHHHRDCSSAQLAVISDPLPAETRPPPRLRPLMMRLRRGSASPGGDQANSLTMAPDSAMRAASRSFRQVNRRRRCNRHGDGLALGAERSGVRGRIDAAGKAAHHDQSRVSQALAKPSPHLQCVGSGGARSHHGDCLSVWIQSAFHPQHVRRVWNRGENTRIPAVSAGNGTRPRAAQMASARWGGERSCRAWPGRSLAPMAASASFRSSNVRADTGAGAGGGVRRDRDPECDRGGLCRAGSLMPSVHNSDSATRSRRSDMGENCGCEDRSSAACAPPATGGIVVRTLPAAVVFVRIGA